MHYGELNPAEYQAHRTIPSFMKRSGVGSIKNDDQIAGGVSEEVYRKLPWAVYACRGTRHFKQLYAQWGMTPEEWESELEFKRANAAKRPGCDTYPEFALLHKLCCSAADCWEAKRLPPYTAGVKCVPGTSVS